MIWELIESGEIVNTHPESLTEEVYQDILHNYHANVRNITRPSYSQCGRVFPGEKMYHGPSIETIPKTFLILNAAHDMEHEIASYLKTLSMDIMILILNTFLLAANPSYLRLVLNELSERSIREGTLVESLNETTYFYYLRKCLDVCCRDNNLILRKQCMREILDTRNYRGFIDDIARTVATYPDEELIRFFFNLGRNTTNYDCEYNLSTLLYFIHNENIYSVDLFSCVKREIYCPTIVQRMIDYVGMDMKVISLLILNCTAHELDFNMIESYAQFKGRQDVYDFVRGLKDNV